jgi:glycosyltransferase involved in cell wall biosynthesis
LAAGKPILAAIDGDAGDIVRSAQAGLVCPSSNAQKLAEAVHFLFKMPQEERFSFGQNGREAACKFYTKEVLVDHIAQLLKDVVSKNR